MGRLPIVSRDRIIAAARGLFARYGFSKTTIGDIAKSLRIGKSSLYYYFRDKEALFREILDRDITVMKERVDAALREAGTPQERLRTYVLLRMKSVKEFATVYAAFKDDYLMHYAFIQKIREGYDRYEEALIRRILEEGVKGGHFSIADVGLTGATVFSAIKGMEYDWAVNVDVSSFERNISSLLDILLYGIMKQKRRRADETSR